MSRFTVLRVEVDSDVVERVLGLTPGVEVVEGFDAEVDDTGPRDDARSRDNRAETDSDDDPGLLDTATPEGDTLEEGSMLREYGLLGVGVSFVMLGIATVGIWWYRRRSGGPADAESPPPSTEFEGPTTTRSTGRPTPATTAERETPADTDEESVSIATDRDDEGTSDTDEDGEDESVSIVTDRDDEPPADTAEDSDAPSTDEPAGRTDDREDVEWTTKWDSEGPEPTGDDTVSDDEAADRTEPRASESVDVAPLLGVAFIALSGALVRWLQGADQ